MGKIDHRLLPKGKKNALLKEIRSTLSAVGLNKEGQHLLEQLLTDSELVMLGRRIQVARRLLTGQPMRRIESDLEVSSQTIRAVDQWLGRDFASYRTVIPTIRRNVKTTNADPYSWNAIRRRYPSHFALINILLTPSISSGKH